jgi:Electron transfer DM13
MQRRFVVIGLSLVAAGAVGWYLFRPERLFLDDRVNEPFPAQASGEMTGPDVKVDDAMMPSDTGPKALAAGTFHSNAHETKGAATIYQLQDGKRVLRLEDFATSNGPDVRVYLVAADDVNDEETVKKAGFVELGKLKGNIGAQNYDVPADLDLAKYRAVTIWCKRFSVNFGTAPLSASKS